MEYERLVRNKTRLDCSQTRLHHKGNPADLIGQPLVQLLFLPLIKIEKLGGEVFVGDADHTCFQLKILNQGIMWIKGNNQVDQVIRCQRYGRRFDRAPADRNIDNYPIANGVIEFIL